MFGWIPEKNHHLGQRRGFEVAGNLIKTWFLPFLLTRFGIFPCCCPYLMGRSKPCGCDSIPKIDPLHPLKEKNPCVLQIIYISICGWVKAFTAHLLPYVQNLETFIIFHWSVQAGGDDFPPIFRSCHIWQPQPSTLETPSDLRGGMAHVPPKGGKLTEFVVDL